MNDDHNCSFAKQQRLSIITLARCIVVLYEGYNKHHRLIQSGIAEIGTSRLYYSKSSKKYYLLVSLELALPEITSADIKRVVG